MSQISTDEKRELTLPCDFCVICEKLHVIFLCVLYDLFNFIDVMLSHQKYTLKQKFLCKIIAGLS